MRYRTYRMPSRSRLEERLRHLAVPPAPLTQVLRGSVVERTTRCGKATCRCARGEPHRSVVLSVTVKTGRAVVVTLPPALVPVARRWIRNLQRWRVRMEQISTLNRLRLQRREVDAAPPPRPAHRRG